MANDSSAVAHAQQLFRDRDYRAALAAFQKLTLEAPNEPHFADRAAHCLSLLKEWNEAKDAWKAAASRFGVTAPRVNGQAQALIQLGDYAKADEVLISAQNAIVGDNNFEIYSAAAAVGTGDVGRAVPRADNLIAAGGEPALNYLCGLLVHLGAQGKSSQALFAVEQLFQLHPTRPRLVRAAIAIAGQMELEPVKLKYAKALFDIDPRNEDACISVVDALIRNGRFDDCREFMAQLDRTMPPQARNARFSQQLELHAQYLPTVDNWRKELQAAKPAESFSYLVFKSSAHLTLKQFEQAADAAHEGIRNYDKHPMFLSLLGRACEFQQKLDEAENCHIAAAQRDPGSLAFALRVIKLLMKRGDYEKAKTFATLLDPKFLRLPVVETIFKRLYGDGVVMEGARPPAEQPGGPAAWLHPGDYGDLVYALAAVKAAGGGRIYLTCEERTRAPMHGDLLSFILPLLKAQPYVEAAKEWNGEPIDHDFIAIRDNFSPDIDLATQHWLHTVPELEVDVRSRWLEAPAAVRHGRPVFARSPRYRNRNWDGLWQALKDAAPDAIFVGTPEEFREFGHGEPHFARDGLELARVIAGASVFVGNQSFPYAIAEGLKVGRLQETSQVMPNCVFPGAIALRLGPQAPPSSETRGDVGGLGAC